MSLRTVRLDKHSQLRAASSLGARTDTKRRHTTGMYCQILPLQRIFRWNSNTVRLTTRSASNWCPEALFRFSMAARSSASNGSSNGDGQCETGSANKIFGVPLIANENFPQSAQPFASKPEIRSLPASYEFTETRILVALISDMVMELININDKIALQQNQLTRFHSRSPPTISVHSYLQRLATHANLSPPILLSMVYYIDLLCEMYPAFTVTSLTIHRFLIVSATVASKGLSDVFWTNKTYARIGGISPAELALLELEFLFRVKWQVVPSPEILVDYYRHLVERCEGFEIESHALQG